MSEVNEIIGRALVDAGLSVEDAILDGARSIETYEEISAAVVKALGEAGHKIVSSTEQEVDITPEMIKAAVLELAGWNSDFMSIEACAARILFDGLNAGGFKVMTDV